MTDKPISDDEIEAVARAIVIATQFDWFTPAEKWTKKDFQHQGVWKEAEAAIRALDAVRAAKSDTCWHPIETAPKDGRTFIAKINDGEITGCWWEKEFDAFISGCRIMQMHSGYMFEDGTTRKLHSPQKVFVAGWIPMPGKDSQ